MLFSYHYTFHIISFSVSLKRSRVKQLQHIVRYICVTDFTTTTKHVQYIIDKQLTAIHLFTLVYDGRYQIVVPSGNDTVLP